MGKEQLLDNLLLSFESHYHRNLDGQNWLILLLNRSSMMHLLMHNVLSSSCQVHDVKFLKSPNLCSNLLLSTMPARHESVDNFAPKFLFEILNFQYSLIVLMHMGLLCFSQSPKLLCLLDFLEHL